MWTFLFHVCTFGSSTFFSIVVGVHIFNFLDELIDQPAATTLQPCQQCAVKTSTVSVTSGVSVLLNIV